MPRALRIFFVVFLLGCTSSSWAQVQGGEHIFEFLRLPSSPHVTALGGLAVINPSADVMMSTINPSLLREKFHTQLGLNYNLYYAGTKISNLYYAHHAEKLNTTFGIGLNYIDYGKFTLTDNLGSVQGDALASDYCFTLSAAKAYLTRWRYGASLKYAHSHLITQKADALLVDLGVSYFDTTNKIYVGAVVKNAGINLRNYEKGNNQPLPLDLQIGILKKFKKAPFAISVTGHHLYTWDVRYDNPADQVDNQLLFGDTTTTKKNYFADKLFRHLVFALDINLGKRLELSAGYNHMRRSELAYSEKKGVSGFSMGAGLYLNRFIIHYARSYYHITGAYNELGINFQLNKLFGLGDSGQKINWSEKFSSSY
jgi:hypothetical protein